MPITDNDTTNRDYDLPHPSNDLADDVARLISALNAIDGDVATLFAGLALKAAAVHAHAIGDVTGLQAALDGKVGTGTAINMSLVTGLIDALAAKAALASPTFTGAPAGPNPSAGENSTRLATTQWVKAFGYLSSIPDLGVTAGKLAALAVIAGKIADGAVDQTSRLADGIVSPPKMSNAAALTILARAANSSGARDDLAAAANGQVLSRLSDTLAFNTLSALFDAVFGATQGRGLQRGASGWEAAVFDAALLSRIFQGVATPLDTQTFDANGTWANPAVGNFVLIEGWSGGQGGHRSTNAFVAQGGDGGNYARLLLPKASITANQSVVIGQGGLGRATSGIGLFGGSTSFGAILTIIGGGVLDTYTDPGSEIPYTISVPLPAAVSWAFGLSTANQAVQLFSQLTAAGVLSHAAGRGSTAGTPLVNSTSTYGGNGGVSGGAGVIPGGGGAGATTTSGAGARGRLIVRTF